MATHGRRLQILGRESTAPARSVWMEAVRENAREDNAVRTLVAFALQLAGTDKLPSRVPTGGGNGPQHMPEPPPPRAAPVSRWANGRRPGPHDILTWEEAMQVPWIDGTASDSSAAARRIEALPQHVKDHIETWGLMIPSYAVEDDANDAFDLNVGAA